MGARGEEVLDLAKNPRRPAPRGRHHRVGAGVSSTKRAFSAWYVAVGHDRMPIAALTRESCRIRVAHVMHARVRPWIASDAMPAPSAIRATDNACGCRGPSRANLRVTAAVRLRRAHTASTMRATTARP